MSCPKKDAPKEEWRAYWNSRKTRKSPLILRGPRCQSEDERIARRRASAARQRKTKRYQEYVARYNKDYFQRTKERQYEKRRQNIANCLNRRIRRNLRGRMYSALTAKRSRGGSAVRDLGCSIEAFRGYIQLQFRPGMSWDNWGEWHIDHIKPLESFDLSDRSQFLKACHYSNMRPLWKAENISRRFNCTSKDGVCA